MSDYTLSYTGEEVNGLLNTVNSNHAAWDSISQSADYIITQGTSGNWHYRKWSSGKAECWYNALYTSISLTNTYGAFYYYQSADISFPFAFVENPTVEATPNSGNGLLNATIYKLTPSSLAFWISNPLSVTSTVNMMIYAIGRWQ